MRGTGWTPWVVGSLHGTPRTLGGIHVDHTAIHMIDGSVQEHSTQAAKDYVRMVRGRLQVEVERQGEQARQTRSYQRLERAISPEALRTTWPEADVDAALDP
jgi:hypothetical protein